jgi:hypothetical protein
VKGGARGMLAREAERGKGGWQRRAAPFNVTVEGGGSWAGVHVEEGEGRRGGGAWRGGRHRPVFDGRGRVTHGPTRQGRPGC